MDPDLIEQAIRATLEAHGSAWGEVSVALVDDAQMAALHEKFMGDPTPTDVLTFDLADDLEHSTFSSTEPPPSGCEDVTAQAHIHNTASRRTETDCAPADNPADDLAEDQTDQSHPTLDGEIVISVDTARRESQNRGHTLSDEVLLYAVHGTLHLLGYDDHTEDEAQAMHRKENEILTRLGIGPVYGEVR